MFIRTKDGIYEVKSHNKNCGVYEVFTKEINCQTLNTLIGEESIITQSSDLAELCDRFVVIDKETKEVMNIVAFWEYAKHWVSWKYNIYGAVWTGKGLIFVAKMNEDGEFELI